LDPLQRGEGRTGRGQWERGGRGRGGDREVSEKGTKVKEDMPKE